MSLTSDTSLNGRHTRFQNTTSEEDENDCLKLKRKRNAEAARKSREKKKELQKQIILELESKLARTVNECQHLRKEYRDICEERSRWTEKEAYFMNTFVKLRSALQKQKEHIIQLQSQNMAFNMSMTSPFTSSYHQQIPPMFSQSFPSQSSLS